MDLDLKGKTALVTGSYRGTGLIIAQTLIEEGVNTLVHGLKAPQAEKAVTELGGGIAITADITTQEGCEELVELANEYSLDIIVNNYGTADPNSWKEGDSGPWFGAYEKNVLSAQRITQGLLPALLKKKWGRVINLGTTGSTKPSRKNPAYYSAKGALVAMTVSLAGELANTGVTANIVSPGLILTPEVKQQLVDQSAKKKEKATWEDIEARVAKDIPIGRIVRREEVANIIAFLCSPKADAIHGQNIKVDGGALGIVS